MEPGPSRDYIAEHERATDLGGAALRALDRGGTGDASQLLAAMFTALRSHRDGEERGLFAVMGRDEFYAEHIRPLVGEQRDLAQLLSTVHLREPADQQLVLTAVAQLREHISKEEDGLFPASLTALTGQEWDVSMLAWHDAHPGEHMVRE